MIAIVDYGLGNIRSVHYKLKNNGVDVVTSSSSELISSADKLILSGVGHFKKGMKNLQESGLVEVLNQKVLIDKIPIFGICIGMHLFAKHSEEGDCEGLGWISGKVKKFNFANNTELNIPHVGWNAIHMMKQDSILESINDKQFFYFTHSYHLHCDEDIILTKTNYGYDFPSSIKKGNIIGTQFHPEKSHWKGFQLLLNFCRT